MTISRLSDNEQAWIEFLRLSSNGNDPALDLASIQLLRRVLDRAEKRKLSLRSVVTEIPEPRLFTQADPGSLDRLAGRGNAS